MDFVPINRKGREMLDVPGYYEVVEKLEDGGKLNPIEHFIHEWEPAGDDDEKKFHEELEGLVMYVAGYAAMAGYEVKDVG